ncbi:hypothetical protein [Blastococcus sp. LR1]|uniref:hypothetical protein n=1 Tax=Blastococcus sp. LR1 TaxID=2877000 RepID=UPI001CCBD78F|nr:hypothetical protein [Blastococcus sp. LR1]MCA0143763.1 hypothetical protein [Blastococcus sp. LR1]
MPQIEIQTTAGETLHITGSDEQAEGTTTWFDEGEADDVMNVHDPRLGTVWIQKRHVVRITVN